MDIGITYLKQADTAYNAILDIVKLYTKNSFTDSNKDADTMEQLLRKGKQKEYLKEQ